MARCLRCWGELYNNKRICLKCMKAWTGMRSIAYETLTEKSGEMTPENYPVFKKEMRRLERIWKKDKNKFEKEIEILKNEIKEREWLDYNDRVLEKYYDEKSQEY